MNTLEKIEAIDSILEESRLIMNEMNGKRYAITQEYFSDLSWTNDLDASIDIRDSFSKVIIKVSGDSIPPVKMYESHPVGTSDVSFHRHSFCFFSGSGTAILEFLSHVKFKSLTCDPVVKALAASVYGAK